MSEPAIRELRNAPSMLPMFAKALMRVTVKPGKSPQLPNIGARLSDVMLDAKHLTQYRKVCGFPDNGMLPITYPHIHAHPLFMSLLLDSRFPFPAIGLVHVANKITQYRPIQEREQLDIECRLGALEKKEAGFEFSLLTSVTTGGELVWESVSTMIYRTGSASGGKKKTPNTKPATEVIEWNIPGNIGRRYGTVSGDRNPIHLYPLTAKLLGFKRQIAHGMWSKARCLAEIEGTLPKEAFSVDVQFKLPMFIPAKVKFEQKPADAGIDFRLLGSDGIKPHLHGQVRKIDSEPCSS